MPPAKKQKTSKESSAPTQEQEPENATPHKNADEPKLRDTKQIPLYEYVCMHRPYFEYAVENREADEADDEDEDEDELHDKYKKEFEEAVNSGVILEPAKDHPEWKWVILWEGFKNFSEYQRRSRYCDPDNFGMYIYNDFAGKGLMELMENLILAFDGALKKKSDDALYQMWAPMSALALFLNEVNMGSFIGDEDGEKVQALTGLMGYALLRALAGLDHAEEMKPDTSFLDLPLVITYFLEWSSNLADYGINGEAIEWRPHAAAYFKKSKIDSSKGVPGTAKLIDKAEPSDESKLPSKTEKGPWKWNKRLKDYKSLHGSPKIGGTKYDITKMSRKERASHAFDNKDPLADVSEKDLKEGNLDFE